MIIRKGHQRSLRIQTGRKLGLQDIPDITSIQSRSLTSKLILIEKLPFIIIIFATSSEDGKHRTTYIHRGRKITAEIWLREASNLQSHKHYYFVVHYNLQAHNVSKQIYAFSSTLHIQVETLKACCILLKASKRFIVSSHLPQNMIAA